MLNRILYFPRADAGAAIDVSAFMNKIGPGPLSDSPAPAIEPASEPPKEPDGKATPERGRDQQKPVAVDDKPGTEKPGDEPAAKAPDAKKPFQVRSPKKETDKAEPKPEPDQDKQAKEEPEEKQPRTNADWEKFKANRKEKEESLRREAETYSTKTKELEAKLAEVESKLGAKPAEDPQAQAALEALKAENAALTERITVLDVTAHPRFEAYFNEKKDAAITKAKRIVGTEKAAEIERILKIQDDGYKQTQLDAFLEEINDFTKARLAVVTDELEGVQTEREGEIRKAREHKETIVGQSTAQQKERQDAFKNMTTKLWSETVSELQDPKNGSPMWQQREGDPEWNAGVAKRVELAKAMLSSNKMDPKAVFRAAFDAAAYPSLIKAYEADYHEFTAQIAKLEAQVASLTKAQPGTSNGAGAGTGAEPSEQRPGVDKKNPNRYEEQFGKRMAAAARELNRGM